MISESRAYEIKVDFINDWHEMIKDVMINEWDMDISNITEENLPISYFSTEERRSKIHPKKVEKSDVFQCPSELKEGWNALESKILNGIDIVPHLSKQVMRGEKTDAMLNDWGIYHFHLGNEFNGPFIERTGPLLFAFISDDTFYAINVFSHTEWTNSNIVEIIHRNWSEEIEKYQLKNVDTLSLNILDEDRNNTRKHNINTTIKVTDGTIYMSLGGGATLSGYGTNAQMKVIRQHRFLRSLEKSLKENQAKIFHNLIEKDYDSKSIVNAKLIITENEYKAFLPKYNLLYILNKKE